MGKIFLRKEGENFFIAFLLILKRKTHIKMLTLSIIERTRFIYTICMNEYEYFKIDIQIINSKIKLKKEEVKHH